MCIACGAISDWMCKNKACVQVCYGLSESRICIALSVICDLVQMGIALMLVWIVGDVKVSWGSWVCREDGVMKIALDAAGVSGDLVETLL